MDAALLYDWKGNLRELRNFVTRTVVMRDTDAATRELEAKAATSVAAAPEQDQPIDTVGAFGAPAPCVGIRSVVREVKARTEAKMIQSALETFGWNRRRAAQHLNMSYRAMLYKIQQHHLRPSPADDTAQSPKKIHSVRNNAV